MKRWAAGAGLLLVMALDAAAQDANWGVVVPVTISGGSLYTDRGKGYADHGSSLSAGFRTVFYPTLKLGEHWFGYSAIKLRLTPYYPYDAYEPERKWVTDVIQAYGGYTNNLGRVTITAKAGQLISAFGSFPMRYDEAENPLIDVPPGYVMAMRLRPDQLPCGVGDLLHQGVYYLDVHHYCGGAPEESLRHGMTPVTLLGLPGAQVDVAAGPLDARFQLTNSSPANPQGLLSSNQHRQWTAGGGYTFAHQLRLGFSMYRGPYMEHELDALLPAGKSVADFPATGTGIDGRWAHGRWNIHAEWQRFRFASPRFIDPPGQTYGYVEAKVIVTPRLFAAFRGGAVAYSTISDATTRSPHGYEPTQQYYETGFGYRLNHYQLIKANYEWVKTAGVSGVRDNVIGVQFVTSVNSLQKAFR